MVHLYLLLNQRSISSNASLECISITLFNQLNVFMYLLSQKKDPNPNHLVDTLLRNTPWRDQCQRPQDRPKAHHHRVTRNWNCRQVDWNLALFLNHKHDRIHKRKDTTCNLHIGCRMSAFSVAEICIDSLVRPWLYDMDSRADDGTGWLGLRVNGVGDLECLSRRPSPIIVRSMTFSKLSLRLRTEGHHWPPILRRLEHVRRSLNASEKGIVCCKSRDAQKQ